MEARLLKFHQETGGFAGVTQAPERDQLTPVNIGDQCATNINQQRERHAKSLENAVLVTSCASSK